MPHLNRAVCNSRIFLLEHGGPLRQRERSVSLRKNGMRARGRKLAPFLGPVPQVQPARKVRYEPAWKYRRGGILSEKSHYAAFQSGNYRRPQPEIAGRFPEQVAPFL